MIFNVLFIADGTISNPILQSQGLPYLFNISSSSNKAHVLSFENSDIDIERNPEFNAIFSQFSKRIDFHFVRINRKSRLPVWTNFILRGLKVIICVNKQFDIKVLHARSFFPAFLSIIYKTFFKHNVSVIYDNRGLAIDERIFTGELRKNSIKEKILRGIERRIFNKCDMMVVVSKAFQNYINISYPEIFNKQNNKMVVIPNRTMLHMNEQEIMEAKKNLKGKIICVYNGSAASWQGIDKLYVIFSLIIKEIPSSSLKIITYNPEIFRTYIPVSEISSEKLDILKVASSKVHHELAKSTFGLLFREPGLVTRASSPIKFAEYLASGLPVLLLEGIGDTEEVILNYGVGVIIRGNNYKDAIIEMKTLLKDPDIHEKCIQVARKEFDIGQSYTQYKSIYQNLTR